MYKQWASQVVLSSVVQSCPTLCDHGLQHARPPCPSPTSGVYSNSWSLSWWCHPTISSSVVPSSSHLQSFPASGSFPMSQFFTAVGQSIVVSALASVLPVNIQDCFPLGWTGWISSQSKGLSLETWVRSLCGEDPLQQGMATHSSILTWRIPWTKEPSRLQSIGLQRIRCHWSDLAHTHIQAIF